MADGGDDDTLLVNDDIVQQLTVAKYALEIGDVSRARAAVDAALAASRRAITHLVGDDPDAAHAGRLVRTRAAAPFGDSDRPGRGVTRPCPQG